MKLCKKMPLLQMRKTLILAESVAAMMIQSVVEVRSQNGVAIGDNDSGDKML